MALITCPHCGKEVLEASSCLYCGKPLAKENTEPAEKTAAGTEPGRSNPKQNTYNPGASGNPDLKKDHPALGALLVVVLIFFIILLVVSMNNFRMWPIMFILVIVTSVLLFVWSGSRPAKCPHCKVRGGVQRTGSKEIVCRPTTVFKTLETKDRNGNVIRTEEVAIPGTYHEYMNYYVCKNCGEEWSQIKSYSVED